MSIISLKDVWLKYKIEFKEDGKVVTEDFWALKNINIEIGKGEIAGIIGENGAGKTTILKIISGMLKPDKGMINIYGKVSTLMEIGSSFHRELTGRENVYIICSLFGLKKEEINAKYDDIVKFADIGRFINAPVKAYSQGMYMRLAFAIAIHIDPDILLIDDIFAVGDIYAQRKCINKMFELKEQGKTIIFVNQDTEMLKRLCTKGIFIREGSIVKEGPIDKICSYYMESVGEKKGIAILERGLLGVVFNNGRLILRWRNKAITCDLGGHTMILSSGRQYLSHTADWDVKKSDTKDEIVAIGKWRDISLIQFWKIVFLNEREFLWETKVQISKDVLVDKFCTKIIFIEAYKKWFTLDGETNFPENFVHEKEWEYNTVSYSVNKLIGLKDSSQTSDSLPLVILDRSQDDAEIKCEVCNTGAEISGRAVQYQLSCQKSEFNYIQDKQKCFSGKIKIFEPEEEIDLKDYLARVKQVVHESYFIRKGSVSLFCKDHRVEIYYQDKLVTGGAGLDTRFECQGTGYTALDGYWVIHKRNSEEIIINISWGDGLPFIQTWRLKLQDSNVILWEIEMEIDEKIKIRNKETELELSEEYEKWITMEEAGGFERLEKKGNTVPLNKYVNEYIGVERLCKIDRLVLPGIIFSYEDVAPKTSYISKIKESITSTKLWYVEIDSKNNFYASPGKYKYFKGEIKVIADQEKSFNSIELIDERAAVGDVSLVNKIQFNRISLIFDNGKGKLFWNGTELTKGLGLYSSVFFKDVWYDSSQASWEVQKLDQKRLMAVGYWPWLPLTQTWKIYLANENTVTWEIKKEIWDEAILEKEQINLMLSDNYKGWFAYEKVKGKFPEKFNEHNGIFWDRLWCGDVAFPIGVGKGRIKKGILTSQVLPTVTLDCSIDHGTSYFIVENTDNLFEARVLQCEFSSCYKCGIDEDRNKYFEGQIKVNI